MMLENKYENKSKLDSEDPEVIVRRINEYYDEDLDPRAKSKNRQGRMAALVESRMNPAKLVSAEGEPNRMAIDQLANFWKYERPQLSASLDELVGNPRKNKSAIAKLVEDINRYAP